LGRLATTEKTNMTKRADRAHGEIVVDLLKTDPEFADEYLATALQEADQPGGQQALLLALRHVAEAQGMAAVADRAGIPRESLYRALGPRGNPTIKTFLAVLNASGLQLSVTRVS
jgi:probable addiction module antidote protein